MNDLIVILFFLVFRLSFFIILSFVIAFYVIFVTAFVARGAVADIVNSFFAMFSNNFSFRMFMTTIASKRTVVIIRKINRIVKCRWHPFTCAVAFVAIINDCFMEIIFRFLMARNTVAFIQKDFVIK